MRPDTPRRGQRSGRTHTARESCASDASLSGAKARGTVLADRGGVADRGGPVDVLHGSERSAVPKRIAANATLSASGGPRSREPAEQLAAARTRSSKERPRYALSAATVNRGSRRVPGRFRAVQPGSRSRVCPSHTGALPGRRSSKRAHPARRVFGSLESDRERERSVCGRPRRATRGNTHTSASSLRLSNRLRSACDELARCTQVRETGATPVSFAPVGQPTLRCEHTGIPGTPERRPPDAVRAHRMACRTERSTCVRVERDDCTPARGKLRAPVPRKSVQCVALASAQVLARTLIEGASSPEPASRPEMLSTASRH
jgi:hypothetical protein